VTDQTMDYRDYLIRQQQQERMAQRFDALFTKDEDHAAAAPQGIENLAYHEAQEAAAAYDYVQASLTDVITQARDLRARIHSGTAPEKRGGHAGATLTRHWRGRICRQRTGARSRRHGHAHRALRGERVVAHPRALLVGRNPRRP
jgi:hypothetical protein